MGPHDGRLAARLDELDLSKFGGTVLPAWLGECTALASLVLGDWSGGCSELTALPERLGECAALATLKLRDCSGLTSLPERLGECAALTDLDLGQVGVGTEGAKAVAAVLSR